MKNWLKNAWEVQAVRVDALSLRERVFLFLSVIACCAALVDVVWLSPTQAAYQQLKERVGKQSTALQLARLEFKSLTQVAGATQSLSDELATVKAHLETTNQSIADLLPTQTQGTPLAQVLVHFLRRHEGLTLIRTAVVAPEAPAPVAPTSTGAPSVALRRQGVELVVSGPYAELTRYVQTLEQALPHVRWGAMTVKSEKQPPELTLQLFLVEVNP